ncbi:MAG: hypothetical protein U0575_01395 [Phycisphaerales bacterium]
MPLAFSRTSPLHPALAVVGGGVRTLATRLRLLVGATAVVAAASVAAPASAQFGAQSGFAEAFKPDFLNRDMAVFNEFLALEEWQRPIIETLLEDYNVSFGAGVESVKEQMNNIRGDVEKGGPAMVAKIMQPVDAWMQEKAKLRDEFLENVKSQLSDAQRERWPKFDRALRRDKTLEQGELAGESVNLVAIVTSLGLDSETSRAVEPVVAEYEIALDNALKSREAVMKAQQESVKQAMIDMDFDAGINATEKIMAARVIVRQTQDAGAEAIAKALPESKATEFLARWHDKAYPKVFRAQPLERTFEAALALPDLTDAQRTGVVKLMDEYRASIVTINDEMLATIRAEEPKDAKRRVETIRARGKSAAPALPARDDPVQKLMTKRDEISEKARQDLEGLLSPEQYAQLPNATRGVRPGHSTTPPDQAGKEAGGKGDRRIAQPGKPQPGGNAAANDKGQPSKGSARRPPGNGAAD